MNGHRFPRTDMKDEREHRRDIALAVQALLNGASNARGRVTLAVAPATTTTITDPRIGPDTQIVLTARTANAAATTGLYAVAATGVATITHNAAAAADRTFDYLLVG